MSWSAHQQALLREIGVHLWVPPAARGVGTAPASGPAPTLPTAAAQAGTASIAVRPVSMPTPTPTPAPAPARHADDAPMVSARPAPPAPTSISRPVTLPADAVDAMDWNELQATVSACRACGLCDSRRQTVFGVGHPQARVMLVGEAPGEQEDRDGEPFVGKAGQLLDNMLRATRLTRAEAGPERQVYIANVLKCRPPQNRNPSPDEVATCEPYLRRQVALVQPEVIIAMGRFAVQSLLASQEPIGRLRGRAHEFAGIPVVVTYHPAYLLRNPLDKSRSWEDLCLARELLDRRPDA
jgi:DNA polymerase